MASKTPPSGCLDALPRCETDHRAAITIQPPGNFPENRGIVFVSVRNWACALPETRSFQSEQKRGQNVVLSLVRQFHSYRLAVPIVPLLLLSCAIPSKVQAKVERNGPLVVDRNSHVVVLEYEAWFGPNAVTFQNTTAKPLLQSKNMQAVGGGYDSADPAIIKQHVEWMDDMGFDAVIIEVTNNVPCIYNSEAFVKKYLQKDCSETGRSQNQSIRDNTGNLYHAWSELGTRLKLIPLLGGFDEKTLVKDADGKTALEKEIDYFGTRMQKYPDRNVIYEGKPLILIYTGAPQDPNTANKPMWFQIRQFLKAHPSINQEYNFKIMAGYLDSQPLLWVSHGQPRGPVQIDPQYGFWSWVDRLNTACTAASCPFPSFNKVGSRVENFTASIATAGQDSWGCPKSNTRPYCPDDALRFGKNGAYATLDAFMAYARKLDPIFLIIHQFNEYGPPDEGFDANTIDDIEPTNLWNRGALEAVKRQIGIYRHGRGRD
jgi:hypothetical protein